MAKLSPLLLAIAIYTAMTIILTSPMILHLGEWMPPGDQSLIAWIMAWDVHALTTDPLNLFNANAFYPYNHNSLAFSETFIGAAIFAAPILLLTNNPALAFNVIWMLSFVASAAGAYLLAKRFTGDEASSLVAGAIYGFCAFRFAHIGHLQLLIACYIPLAILALDMCLRERRARDFALLYACLALQALTCVYYAYYLMLALLLYGAYVMTKEQDIRMAVKTDRDLQLKAVVAGIALLVTLTPFILTYLDARDQYGFVRNEIEIFVYSADALDFLVSPTTNVLYGWICPIISSPLAVSEHALFPGLITVLLSIVCISWLRKKDGAAGKAAFFVLMAILSLVLMAGSGIHIFGNVFDLPMPYEVLYASIPGFNAMRVPSRFAIMLMLSLSMLAAFGFQRLASVVTSQQKAVITVACMLLIMLESLEAPLSMESVAAPDKIPEVYKWLATQEDPVSVIEIPAGHIEPGNTLWINTRYMYYSTFHWKPILNGYSGFFPPGYYDVIRILESFPSDDSISVLQRYNVTYVIVHDNMLTQNERDNINNGIKNADGLAEVATFDHDRVYRILPGDHSGLSNGFMGVTIGMPDKMQRGITYGCSLRLTNNNNDSYVSSPDEMAYVDVYAAGIDRALLLNTSLRLPVMVASGSYGDVPFKIIAPPESGYYDFEVNIDVPSWGRNFTYTCHIEVSDSIPEISGPLDFMATFNSYDVPSIAAAGSTINVCLDVTNEGKTVWRTHDREGPVGVVRLGIIWKSDNFIDDDRVKIPYDVAPGQRIMLDGVIKAPTVPGNYTLTLWPVDEGIAWAADTSPGRPILNIIVL